MAATGSTQKRGKARNGNGAPGPVIALPHGRVPPHNLDAEKSLLGGVLLDRAAPLRELAEICSAADFYRDAHRKIWEAMLSLQEDGEPVDRVTVKEALVVRGDLEAAGGEEYIELLDNTPPISANLAYYAGIVRSHARRRRVIETASTIVQLGYDQHGEVDDLLADAEQRLRNAAEGRSSQLPPPISLSRARLRATPPRREYMLRNEKGQGVFVQGKVGLLGAPGGTGKSWALSGLTVAIATGRPWFGVGGWAPASPGRVLFIMAEEDEEEVVRQLHHAANALGVIEDEDLDLLAANVDSWGLPGHGVALTVKDEGRSSHLPETTFAKKLRDRVRIAAAERRPYRLIILDPFSRFAGVDTEKDPAAATRWVQVVETCTTPELGRPSALVSCHTGKPGSDGTERRLGSDRIRGTTALRDAARWAAIIEQKPRKSDAADLLTLKIVKANGVAPQFFPLYLCRDQSNEGALRIATPLEIASHKDVAEEQKAKVEEFADYRDRVLAVVKPGHIYKRDDLVEMCKPARRGAILAAINDLLRPSKPGEPAELQEDRKSHRISLNNQLEVPAVPSAGTAGGKGTETTGSGAISQRALPSGNSREPSVPGQPLDGTPPSGES